MGMSPILEVARGSPMTFEERIERLTERHEALAQSVELMLVESREHTKQIERLIVAVREDSENVRALVRIAEMHERRLTDLEGGEGGR
jgi:archaellum component FlaC